MKQLFIISALVGILLQTFNTTGILATYQLNKKYIAKNLCENKNKPKMNCNGKCHLKKQLAKADKKEQSPVSRNLKQTNEVQFFQEQISFETFLYSKDVSYYSTYFFSKTSAHTQAVFHPPSC